MNILYFPHVIKLIPWTLHQSIPKFIVECLLWLNRCLFHSFFFPSVNHSYLFHIPKHIPKFLRDKLLRFHDFFILFSFPSMNHSYLFHITLSPSLNPYQFIKFIGLIALVLQYSFPLIILLYYIHIPKILLWFCIFFIPSFLLHYLFSRRFIFISFISFNVSSFFPSYF